MTDISLTPQERIEILKKLIPLIQSYDTTEEYQHIQAIQCVRQALQALDWRLSSPLGTQWHKWHCITEEGGVIPFSLAGLVSALLELDLDTRIIDGMPCQVIQEKPLIAYYSFEGAGGRIQTIYYYEALGGWITKYKGKERVNTFLISSDYIAYVVTLLENGTTGDNEDD